MIKKLLIGSIIASATIYAASIAGCVGCHGQNFEKKALGVSKVVKNMSKEDIIKALKGYKAGTYGGAQKGVMKGQVAALSDKDIEDIANMIKSGKKTAPVKTEAKKTGVKELPNVGQYKAPDLNKPVDATELGLRKSSLTSDKVTLPEVKYNAPAPGSATRYARSYVNAPPLIPHSVDGLLPITIKRNACLDCHMPDKAKAVGATPIPPSHFMDYRPDTKIAKNGAIEKDGKVIKNTSDIKVVQKKLKKLYPGRYNCSQCHVPQANVKPLVKNTFKPDFTDKSLKEKSDLYKVIDEGVK